MTAAASSLRSPRRRPREDIAGVEPVTPADMLHFIRASVKRILREAGTPRRTHEAEHEGAHAVDHPVDHAADHAADHAVERALSRLLGMALVTRSPMEIAIALGSAAELMMFPAPEVLEACTAAVDAGGHRTLRGVVWAVRHRSSKAGRRSHRFAVELEEARTPSPPACPSPTCPQAACS